MLDNDEKPGVALSNDQLLDYIKKQKSKIKRLEKEKETLHKENVEHERQIGSQSQSGGNSALSSDNSSLFWGLIDKESPFKQKLAKSALNFLIGTISKSSLGRKCVMSKRTLFDRWKEHILLSKLSTMSIELQDSNKSFVALEQKTAKLKALLARTHQSNQRFQEDTTSFKKIQKDAALQLKTLKERDESERMALLETVRVRTIETAFQYDMELAIQRAADGMTLSQTTLSQNGSNNPSSSKKCFALEEENNCLREKLTNEELKYSTAKEELKALRKHSEALEAELSASEDSSLFMKKKISKLEFLIAEDDRLRQDLEVELELVTRGRGEMIRNMEQNFREKHSQAMETLKSDLSASPKGSSNSSSHEDSRDGRAELQAALSKIEQLKATIAALKSNGSHPNTSTFLKTYSSSSSLNPGIIGVVPGNKNKSNALENSRRTLTLMNSNSLSTPNLSRRGSKLGTGTGAGTGGKEESTVPEGREQTLPYTADAVDSDYSYCPDSKKTTSYTCESLVLKAANDFRLILIVPAKKSFRIAWDFSVSAPVKHREPRDRAAHASSSSSSHTSSTLDIGFSVMEKLDNGALPQLIAYSRVKSSSKKVALFETEGGEASTKSSDQSDGNETGTEATADIPTTPDGGGSTPLSNGSEKSRSDPILLHDTGKEGRESSARETADDLGGDHDRDAVRTLIVLFDNSYSWYKPKEIKYAITVEVL